jgi:invasion protein IalB
MVPVLRWSIVSPLTLASSLALAQEQTTAKYGDWTLNCVGQGSGKSCGLVQTQRLPQQATPASQIGVGRKTKAQPLTISVEIPADAWVPAGVRLMIDNSVGVLMPFRWCVSTRCFADAELSNSDLTSLRTKKDAGILLYKTASQGDVSIPVSFNGFSEALGAFQKQ